jgi:hypothetical protein
MRIVLAGGTGFIGRAMVGAYRAEHTLEVLTRHPDRVQSARRRARGRLGRRDARRVGRAARRRGCRDQPCGREHRAAVDACRQAAPVGQPCKNDRAAGAGGAAGADTSTHLAAGVGDWDLRPKPRHDRRRVQPACQWLSGGLGQGVGGGGAARCVAGHAPVLYAYRRRVGAGERRAAADAYPVQARRRRTDWVRQTVALVDTLGRCGGCGGVFARTGRPIGRVQLHCAESLPRWTSSPRRWGVCCCVPRFSVRPRSPCA